MGPKWLWVVVVLSMFALEAGWSNGCWEQERLALLQLKSFFLDLEREEGSNCCQWKSVECNITTGRVTKLVLDYATQTSIEKWYLNISLFLPFEELWSLNLKGNNIAGCVENEDFGKLSKLSRLEILDLSENFFNNSILADLSGLSNLKSLSLRLNQLNGSVDIKEFCGWSNLETLYMSNNTVNQFVTSKGNGRQQILINLKELDLSGNLFNNSLLADFSAFPNLKSLYLSGNQLEGSIDVKELCTLSNLETLDMSYNAVNQFVTSKENRCLRKLKTLYLDGVFKQNFSLVSLVEPFSSVKALFLRNNYYFNITVFTQELHVLSNVEDLLLDYTPLDIKFLESIGSLTSLKTLSLYNCSLADTLPTQGWCYLKSLEELNLSRNGLRGMIASCLGNLTFLRYLDISYNQFTGSVASTPLTNLTMLQFLSLSNNDFQVPVSFMSFANHSNLKIFISDGNKLVEQPVNFQTSSPKFQLKIFIFSNCIIEEHRKLQLPNFLYYQYDLRYVDLSHTNFSEISFPDWLVENNSRLEALYMKNSSIMGPLFLPSHPNYNLRLIDISNNEMQHQIPTNICSLFPNLKRLFMSRNAFKSNIPLCLGGMMSLSYLDMSHNQLLGGIPEELAMSRSLIKLKLSNSTLRGKMFPAIYRSNKLLELYLDGNNFDGDMPQFSPISSSFLETLDLSDNHLSGKLPRWLGHQTMLEILALSNNQFEGPIPMELCNMVNLNFLDLSQNHLSGTIPSCFSLQEIQHVHLSKNKLSGPLSPAFYGSSSLVTLDLSENNFTGNIPDWNGTLPALSVLLLKANQLHGEFPVHLCKLHSLSIVDLSQNKLFGPIPSCVSNLTLKQTVEKSSISTMNVHFASWDKVLADMELKIYDLEGREYFQDVFDTSPSYPDNNAEEEIVFSTKRVSYNYTGNILDWLSGIDLSCNQLTGIIPLEFGNLSEIRALNLSHNNFTGPIPSTFSKLKQIESLDLSYNNLNGSIPPQLTELYTLAVFTVAYNNLSGPLPDMKYQFGTFNESSYEGNLLLCGPPLNSCSEADSPETPSASSGEDDEHGFIDIGDFYICFGVSYAIMLLGIAIVLYINPYWRRTWFYFVEKRSTACYFFIMDGLHRLPCFRRNI